MCPQSSHTHKMEGVASLDKVEVLDGVGYITATIHTNMALDLCELSLHPSART